MMDWSKQAEAMMQTWTETQKKMWEGWFEMAQSASANNNSSPYAAYPEMMGQWQKMAAQSIEAWSASVDPTAQNVARQMMASQEMMMRFMQSITQAWQAIAPKMQTGEDWQSVLRDYSAQWVQNMFGFPIGAMSVNKDTKELFQFYMAEWSKLIQPWMISWLQSPNNLGHIMMGGSSELAQLSRFHWDVYERTFGGMTEVPGMGYNRELNAKLLGSFDSWVDMQKASAEYHTILSRAFGQSFESFMKKLVDLSEKGESIDSMQDLINLWFDTVDEVFVVMYVSEEYLEIQKNLAAAAMTNRMRLQEVLEIVLKMFDLPTRSELDDAYKALNDLRREVRALKKTLKEQGRPVTAASKKKIEPKRASNGKSSVAASPTTSDDLTRIWGIGPKIDQLLHEKGVDTYAQLAHANVDEIGQILEEAGTYRLSGRELLESWPKQAELAAAGEWDKLEAFQQQVKSKKGA
jgi:class III poly(R)-hydroxyalkanoic acid synthase PhaE subunit